MEACYEGGYREPYHDRLSLVLDDMARSADLIPPSQAEEHELIRRIDWLLQRGSSHRRGFPLGRHGSVTTERVFGRRQIRMFSDDGEERTGRYAKSTAPGSIRSTLVGH